MLNFCESVENRLIILFFSSRADLGDVRIQFGSHPLFVKNFSKLRLLPEKNTVGSVIQTVKKFFPLVETQLTQPLTMSELSSDGHWRSLYDCDSEITNIGQYYLKNMRLPHKELSDGEVEKWIVTLLISGDHLTKNDLTKEEFHRKCSTYAMRVCSSVISQEYIDSMMTYEVFCSSLYNFRKGLILPGC